MRAPEWNNRRILLLHHTLTGEGEVANSESVPAGTVKLALRVQFLSPDPLDASPSTYVFALDNPIMYVDPSGLAANLPDSTGFYSQFMPPVNQLNRGYRVLVTKAMIAANVVYRLAQDIKAADQRRLARIKLDESIQASMRASAWDPRHPPDYTNQYRINGKYYNEGDQVDQKLEVQLEGVTISEYRLTTTFANGLMTTDAKVVSQVTVASVTMVQLPSSTMTDKEAKQYADNFAYDLATQGIKVATGIGKSSSVNIVDEGGTKTRMYFGADNGKEMRKFGVTPPKDADGVTVNFGSESTPDYAKWSLIYENRLNSLSGSRRDNYSNAMRHEFGHTMQFRHSNNENTLMWSGGMSSGAGLYWFTDFEASILNFSTYFGGH